MSKLFAVKKLFLKSKPQLSNTKNSKFNNINSINITNQEITQLIQDQKDNNSFIDPDLKPKLNGSFLNNANKTIDIKNINQKICNTPLELPQIQSNRSFKNELNLFKIKTIKTKHQINSSNSSTNIHINSNYFDTHQKSIIKRDKTQVDLFKDLNNNNNYINVNTNNYYLNYINNNKYDIKPNIFTNIFRTNIKNNNNSSTPNKIMKNNNKNELDNITNTNIHTLNKENEVDNGNLNTINEYFPIEKTLNFRIQKANRYEQKQKIKKLRKGGHSSSVENKNNSLGMVGNFIINKNRSLINIITGNVRSISKNTKFSSKGNNYLPDITNNTNINIYDSNKEKDIGENYEFLITNKEEIEKIEEANIYFLMNFNKDNNENFINFLKIVQIHVDISLLIMGINFTNENTNIIVSDDIMYKLLLLINNYFHFLSILFKDDLNYNSNKGNLEAKNSNKNNSNTFFNYQILNYLLNDCIKCQMCLFSSILISANQLTIYDFSILLKNYFTKIVTEISETLLDFYGTFIKEELTMKYQEYIEKNLRNDFNENYSKLYENINKNKKTNFENKKDAINKIISNIKKSINSLKYYSAINLKYSLIKPYGDALNQLIFSLDKKNVNEFALIFINTILYGELHSNKKKVIENTILYQNSQKSSDNTGSAIINNINEDPPFLPPINPKYKYTLVLDMDETLIYFFFTNVNGMFFIRPFCFYFLNELSKYYEIVTFTAGTKEYADNILNMLDLNDNIFKYRLYRQHITIIGCNVFKNLSKLGRDLSKVIIIDNVKDNFKMQQNNGLVIKTWTSDINDNQFYYLTSLLKDIALLEVNDVRPIIKKINDDIQINRNIINPYANVNVGKILSSLEK